METVTLFQDFNRDIEQITIEDLMFRIKTGHWRYVIQPLRIMIKEGNRAGYDSAKRKLLAFTASGQFKRGRKIEYLIKYTHILVLDFDKLTEEELIAIKRIINQCIYTLACFVSPSGNGLKVLVSVSTDVQDHKRAFLSVQQFYQKLTGVQIDPSGKDVTRLCFVSVDTDLYYNPGATIFNPGYGTGAVAPIWSQNKAAQPAANETEGITGNEINAFTLQTGIEADATKGKTGNAVNAESIDQGAKVADGPVKGIPEPMTPLDGSPAVTDDPVAIYRQCIAKVERSQTFIAGNRNNFVYKLALELNKAGVPRQSTELWLLRDYNYHENEVRQCILSAYKHNFSGETTGGGRAENDTCGQNSPKASFLEPGEGMSSIKALRQNLPDEELIRLARQIDSLAPGNPDTPQKEKKKETRQLYDMMTVMEYLKAWYEFYYNEVIGMVMWREAGSDEPFKRLSDNDENSMFCRLHFADQKIPIGTLHIILYSDFSPDYDPFHDYFDHLPEWDGVTDYIGQLSDTVTTADRNYWEFCFRKWIVAYVGSLLVESVVNHTVIVMVGGQGVGKSSWINRLLPKAFRQYISNVILQANHKDNTIMLTECALLVLDEMDSLGRKDLAAFKELVTQLGVHIRRPYGRNSENLPHRASFIASVNNQQILTDPTGSRRYLCATVLKIDYEHTVDIDGVMAQAYALFRSGFKYWFDQEEINEITVKNDDFTFKSIEEELILQWLRKVSREEWDSKDLFVNKHNISLMSATEICSFLTEKAKIMVSDFSTIKIGKIMAKYKYERIKRDNFQYLVRIVDVAEVDKSRQTMADPQADESEQASNDQIIRFDEDLFGNTPDDILPF